ncbi:STAS domain-containing protein [Amycolatopsis rhizosphaerae]|uniref:Anti-sigma factor antagonist n=1 Tax=Amycolatopsis rhizosphaerae TaxID=2053003 RepID=A0A558D5K2_9PSEU|nr:STAS domain-containing protein [Amycolatopsis rhizosphaerae]TVT56295.1 STAS domain-containing protein [Amycolatopsis rhizosphaerae]
MSREEFRPTGPVPGQRPPAGALGLRVRRPNPGQAVLEVSGELDMATAPQLARALDELRSSPDRVLLVDLAGVGFLGSSGLAVLVNLHRELEPGRLLRIVAPSRDAYRAFAVTGLAGELPLYRSYEDALATL